MNAHIHPSDVTTKEQDVLVGEGNILQPAQFLEPQKQNTVKREDIEVRETGGKATLWLGMIGKHAPRHLKP